MKSGRATTGYSLKRVEEVLKAYTLHEQMLCMEDSLTELPALSMVKENWMLQEVIKIAKKHYKMKLVYAEEDLGFAKRELEKFPNHFHSSIKSVGIDQTIQWVCYLARKWKRCEARVAMYQSWVERMNQ